LYCLEEAQLLIKKFLVLVVALLLTACGYHLRGSVELPAGLKNIYLDGGSAQLREQFGRAMESSSGKLVSSPKGAVVVKILGEDSQRRALSLSSKGKANEFELGLLLDYELFGAGNELLLERQPVEVRRSYYNDQQDIIAKDSEEAVIRAEMYQQAVLAIISRARIALAGNSK
jgi:LPS-assembly lipoprotein